MEATHLPKPATRLSRIIHHPTDNLTDQVRHAIKQAPDAERFGDRKVYLSWIMDTTGATAAQLLDMNRQHEITMVRADMPQYMDLDRVAASHIHHLNRDFHFAIDPTRD